MSSLFRRFHWLLLGVGRRGKRRQWLFPVCFFFPRGGEKRDGVVSLSPSPFNMRYGMAETCVSCAFTRCVHKYNKVWEPPILVEICFFPVVQAIGKKSRHVKQIIVEVKLSTWRPVHLLGTRHRSPHLRFEKHFDHRRLRPAAAESVSSSQIGSPDQCSGRPRPENETRDSASS